MRVFHEPSDSSAYDVTSYFDDYKSHYVHREREVERALKEAILGILSPDSFVYAYCVNHASYRFYPGDTDPDESWSVEALPDGDYSLFVAPDLRFGWLSNPGEKSVCIYGDLRGPMSSKVKEFGWPLMREGGRPLRKSWMRRRRRG